MSNDRHVKNGQGKVYFHNHFLGMTGGALRWQLKAVVREGGRSFFDFPFAYNSLSHRNSSDLSYFPCLLQQGMKGVAEMCPCALSLSSC